MDFLLYFMFLRIIDVKKSNRQYQYLKLVETAWNKGKVTQKTLLNFGNIEQWPKEKLAEFISKLTLFCNLPPAVETTEADVTIYHALDYGAPFILDALWKELKLSECIRKHVAHNTCEIDIVPPVKAMVFNRLIEPSSKLKVFEWVKTQVIPEVYPQDVPLHHYYRSLDYLMAHKTSLEEDVFWNVNDIFNIDLSLVFYDLTSSYFEGDRCEIATHGYSRDHRPDRRQIEIGLLVNRDGIPLAHEVWEGNVKDGKTVPDTLTTLQHRFNVKRCVFVGDNGMATPENIHLLREKHYEYIMSLKLLKDARALQLLQRFTPDDYLSFQKLKDNLLIREIPAPITGFHTDERVIICYNPERAQTTKQRRDERLKKSQEYLQTIRDTPPKQGRRKKPEKITSMVERYLRKQGTYKYFTGTFTTEGAFEYQTRTDVLDQAAKTDGIWIILTNAQHLTSAEIALGYKTLYEVEHAFREIKDFLRIRPIYHSNDLRVRGHVFICVLAYLLEKILENKLQSAAVKLSPQKVVEHFKSMRMVTGEVMGKPINKITEISKEQKTILNSLGFAETPKFPTFIQENQLKNQNIV